MFTQIKKAFLTGARWPVSKNLTVAIRERRTHNSNDNKCIKFVINSNRVVKAFRWPRVRCIFIWCGAFGNAYVLLCYYIWCVYFIFSFQHCRKEDFLIGLLFSQHFPFDAQRRSFQRSKQTKKKKQKNKAKRIKPR